MQLKIGFIGLAAISNENILGYLNSDDARIVAVCDPSEDTARQWLARWELPQTALLRQYFPKGTDLSRHSADDLSAVAAALNSRPRKSLGWHTPVEALNDYILSVQEAIVATIP